MTEFGLVEIGRIPSGRVGGSFENGIRPCVSEMFGGDPLYKSTEFIGYGSLSGSVLLSTLSSP